MPSEGTSFRWTEVQEQVFQKLQDYWSGAPVLVYPYPQIPFIINGGASNDGALLPKYSRGGNGSLLTIVWWHHSVDVVVSFNVIMIACLITVSNWKQWCGIFLIHKRYLACWRRVFWCGRHHQWDFHRTYWPYTMSLVGISSYNETLTLPSCDFHNLPQK